MATLEADAPGRRDGTSTGTGARRSTAVYDWSACIVGLALIVVPFLLPRDTLGRISMITSGVAVLGLGLAARASRGEHRWHWHLLAAVVGLWLVAMPALWYDITRVFHFASAIGGAVVILLMIPPLWFTYQRANARRDAAAGNGRR